jgi:hypothetical protein
MKPTMSRLYRTIAGALLTVACGLVSAAGAAVVSPGAKAEIKGRINKRASSRAPCRGQDICQPYAEAVATMTLERNLQTAEASIGDRT